MTPERVDVTVGSLETWNCSLKIRMIKKMMAFYGEKAKRALVSSWGGGGVPWEKPK
jgi:hypothetical protein